MVMTFVITTPSFDKNFEYVISTGNRWSQWPRGLSCRSAAARLLRSWVRIPPRAWMFVCCKCCVLSGRGLCDELTTRPEESYRLWCVAVWYRNLVYDEPNINQLWFNLQTGDISLDVSPACHLYPASTLAYRIHCTLIADLIMRKKVYAFRSCPGKGLHILYKLSSYLREHRLHHLQISVRKW
jgi:hypothetical protein